ARTRYRYRLPADRPVYVADEPVWLPTRFHDAPVEFCCCSTRTLSTGRAVLSRRVHDTRADDELNRLTDTPVGDCAARYGRAGKGIERECVADPDGMLPDKPDTRPEALTVRVDP